MRARRKKDYILALYEPKGQAIAMRRFLDRPELIDLIGKQSQQLIAEKNPSSAANSFIEVIYSVLGKDK